LYEAMEADPRIHADPAPFVGLSAFNANDIAYVARGWCDSADYWGVYFDMNERVRDIFAEKGIEFSYPHIVVHTDKNDQ
ncbi:MAG: mechanosensitive ion channel family protein, partial [Oscillospiraceae bacterium]|nr:mechanosensitive ion channel family protein [Oscillospiraceae bacterium]